jgi:uncharacterized protein (TIGR04255 family)
MQVVELAMNQDSPFKPINSAHAIVECVIFFEFAPFFSQAVRERFVNNLASQLKHDLPKIERKNIVETAISVKDGNPSWSSKEELSGVELQRIKSDGTLEWMLRTTQNIISVHNLDYTRWDNIWIEAKKYLQTAFEPLQGADNFVNSIGIKYIDRFVYDGAVDNYQISNLFSEETDLLPRKLFASNPLWHSHIGWFENVKGIGLPCLNQINIDGTYANFSNRKKPVVTIEHNAILRAGDNLDSISSYLSQQEEDKDSTKLDQIMHALHIVNKGVLSSLLNDKMKININLGSV